MDEVHRGGESFRIPHASQIIGSLSSSLRSEEEDTEPLAGLPMEGGQGKCPRVPEGHRGKRPRKLLESLLFLRKRRDSPFQAGLTRLAVARAFQAFESLTRKLLAFASLPRFARKRRDSNPRYLAVHLISNQTHSATLPLFQIKDKSIAAKSRKSRL